MTMTASPALIGFGQVRHARLKPRHHAFAYPTYFLLLPMRSLQSVLLTMLGLIAGAKKSSALWTNPNGCP